MIEKSPKLMKTRHLGMQTEKNLKQYVKKTNPYLDIRRNRRTEHKEKKVWKRQLIYQGLV